MNTSGTSHHLSDFSNQCSPESPPPCNRLGQEDFGDFTVYLATTQSVLISVESPDYNNGSNIKGQN